MNTVITIKGVSYPLHFGRLAVEEMTRRTFSQVGVSTTSKVFTDMVYCGMVNQAVKLDIPSMSYPEVFDLMDEFFDQEDCAKQQEGIEKVFAESKFGKEFLDYAKQLTESLDALDGKEDDVPKKKKTTRSTGKTSKSTV